MEAYVAVPCFRCGGAGSLRVCSLCGMLLDEVEERFPWLTCCCPGEPDDAPCPDCKGRCFDLEQADWDGIPLRRVEVIERDALTTLFETIDGRVAVRWEHEDGREERGVYDSFNEAARPLSSADAAHAWREWLGQGVENARWMGASR